MRERQLPGFSASGNCAKNLKEQSPHCFMPPLMRRHFGLPHCGQETLGTKARYAQPAMKAARLRMTPGRGTLGTRDGSYASQCKDGNLSGLRLRAAGLEPALTGVCQAA